MTDNLTLTNHRPPELDEDQAVAGLLLMLLGAVVFAFMATSGFLPYVLSMAAGAWLHKRFA